MKCSSKSEQTARDVVKLVLASGWLVGCTMWPAFQVLIAIMCLAVSVFAVCFLSPYVVTLLIDWLFGGLSICDDTT